jgi:hypothetical protein
MVVEDIERDSIESQGHRPAEGGFGLTPQLQKELGIGRQQ